MKEIPVGLQEEYNKKFGSSPTIIIKIAWESGTKLYSNYDGTCTIDSVPYTIYNAIKEFSNFSHQLRYDNVGAQHQISLSLFDYSGHFKDEFLHSNLYTIDCSVYLGSPNIQSTLELFSGKIRDPIEYNVDAKIFNFDIVSYDLNVPVGYTPSIDFIPESNESYELYKYFLNTETWPLLFDAVRYKPPLLLKMVECVTKEDLDYHSGATPYLMELEGDLLTYLVEGNFYTFHIVTNNVTLLVTGDIVKYPDSERKSLRFYNNGEGDSNYALEPVEYTNIHVLDQSGNGSGKLTLEIEEGVWIEGLVCEIQWEGGSTTYGKCSKQNDNIVTIELPTTYISIWNGTITYLQVTSILSAKSVDYYPTSLARGTRLILLSHPHQGVYILDAKDDYQPGIVPSVWIQGPNGLEHFPTNLREILEAPEIWEGVVHPFCRVMRLLEPAYLYFEKRNISFEEIYVYNMTHVRPTSTYEVCNILIEAAPKYSMVETSDNHVSRFVIQDSKDLVTLLSEIAWQKYMLIVQVNPNKLKLIDLAVEEAAPKVIRFTFTNQNIHSTPVIMDFKNIGEVKTYIEATVRSDDHINDTYKLIEKLNDDIYGVLKYEVDYYNYFNRSSVQAVIDAWLQKLSTPCMFIKFTGYLDAVHLELWDRVQVNLGQVTYYDVTKYLPVTNILPQGSNETLIMDGVIIDINLKPTEGVIDFIVKLDRSMGES